MGPGVSHPWGPERVKMLGAQGFRGVPPLEALRRKGFGNWVVAENGGCPTPGLPSGPKRLGLKASGVSHPWGCGRVGKGRPRFRLSPENVARIEELAPLYGGRDAVVSRALDCLAAGPPLSRLERLVGELADAVERVRALAADLERLPGRGPGAPEVPVAADQSELKDFWMRAFSELEGARQREGGGLAYGEDG